LVVTLGAAFAGVAFLIGIAPGRSDLWHFSDAAFPTLR
jgi:hypothetical protein